jgi:hypothetical protein
MFFFSCLTCCACAACPLARLACRAVSCCSLTHAIVQVGNHTRRIHCVCRSAHSSIGAILCCSLTHARLCRCGFTHGGFIAFVALLTHALAQHRAALTRALARYRAVLSLSHTHTHTRARACTGGESHTTDPCSSFPMGRKIFTFGRQKTSLRARCANRKGSR